MMFPNGIPIDPASADIPTPDFTSGFNRDLTGLKLAYPRSFFAAQEGISPEIVVERSDPTIKVLPIVMTTDRLLLPFGHAQRFL